MAYYFAQGLRPQYKWYKNARTCRESPFPVDFNDVTRVGGIVLYRDVWAGLRRPPTNLAVAHLKLQILCSLQLGK